MTLKINTWFVGSKARKSALRIYYPVKRKKSQIILFAHGFKGFKDWGTFPKIQEKFAEEGFTVVAFNFSHNGGTFENPIDFPDLAAFAQNNYLFELQDIGHVLNWMEKNKEELFENMDLNAISILGHSRGGGIALLAAEKYRQIKGVVTWAAVADFEERLPDEPLLKEWKSKDVHYIRNGRTQQDMPMNYSFIETFRNYSSELNIQKAVRFLRKPLLVIHGAEDETVLLKDAKRISSWSSFAKICVVEHANHTLNGKHPWLENELPDATKKAMEETIKFLKSKISFSD